MGNIYFYCKKCREKEAIKDFSLCESCNADNWQPGDKLIALKDSEPKKWYKKGDVFTFKKSLLGFFSLEEDCRRYNEDNFKLYKEEKTMFEKGQKIVNKVNEIEGTFECYLCAPDRWNCDFLYMHEGVWNTGISEDFKLVPKEPKYAIGDEFVSKEDDNFKMKILFVFPEKTKVPYINTNKWVYAVRYYEPNGNELNTIVSENELDLNYIKKDQKCTFDE